MFDYFLPEKWRKTPRTVLTDSERVYETKTKDDIHLVCRVSRVGRSLPADAPPEAGEHGYNSPFEEVVFALELSNNGVETTYPRAIYMSRHKTEVVSEPGDTSRYQTHQGLLTPDGHPVLSYEHEYIVLWGFWNGPDEMLAEQDKDYYRPVDLYRARQEGLVTRGVCDKLMQVTSDRLLEVGVEALRLKPDHLLLSVGANGKPAMDANGLPRVLLSSFDLLRHTSQE